MILLVTLCLFVIITTAGSALYASSKSVLQSEVSEPQIHLLRIGMEAVNNSVGTADQIGVNMVLSSLTYAFLDPGYLMPQAEIARLVEYLDNLTVSPAVESVMIYDMTRLRIAGSTPYGYSSEPSNLFDTDWQRYIADVKPNHFTIVDRTKSSQFGFEQKSETITLFRPVVRGDKPLGVVMVNLNKKKLFDKIFENYTSQTDAFRFVVDDSGHIIYETNNRMLTREQLADAVSQSGKTYFDFSDGKQSYLVTQVASDITGWRFVSIITQQRLLQKVDTIRNIVFGLSLISMVCGVVGIFVTHHISFKPVRRIRQLLSAGQPPSKGSEPDLEEYLLKLTSELSDASSVVRHNLAELRTKYAQDAIAGRMSAWEMKDRWHRHFKEWTDMPLFTVLLSIDAYYQWAGAYSEEDRHLLRFAMKNVCEEWMGVHWRIALVEHDLNLLLIVQKKTDDQQLDQLRNDLAGLIQTIRKLIQVGVTAAVSNEYADPADLRSSFLQAELALTYRLYSGYSQVLTLDSLKETAERKPIDPLWKKDLLMCLQGGKEDIALQLLDSLRQQLEQSPVPPAEAIAFLQQLMDELLSSFDEHGLAKPGFLRRYNRDWFRTMSLDDTIQLFVRLFGESSALLDQRASSRDFLVVQQMIRFMKLHLHENIGVPEIADSVGLSKSSVNSIFKQEMNRTLYDYLTELRMHEAEAWLADSELKIAEIAVKVGYQNENSLIRAFRKHRSMTPGQFREMARKTQSSDTAAD